MLKDITLGQFFPGDTIVHRLDPRTKILLVIVYIVALFRAQTWAGYAAVTLATVLCMALSKIKPSVIFKGVKPMLFIIALTAALNIFYTAGTPIRPSRTRRSSSSRFPDDRVSRKSSIAQEESRM